MLKCFPWDNKELHAKSGSWIIRIAASFLFFFNTNEKMKIEAVTVSPIVKSNIFQNLRNADGQANTLVSHIKKFSGLGF